jgi:hypothetical protein
MADKKSSLTKMVHLPLEKDLLDAIKDLAAENERSILGEIRFAIKKHLAASKSGRAS